MSRIPGKRPLFSKMALKKMKNPKRFFPSALWGVKIHPLNHPKG